MTDSETDVSLTFKIVWRNLGNCSTNSPPFAKRANRLKRQLIDLDADIICLTECKDGDAVDDYPEV